MASLESDESLLAVERAWVREETLSTQPGPGSGPPTLRDPSVDFLIEIAWAVYTRKWPSSYRRSHAWLLI